MSSSDRFPYKTATVLDQPFLNACADNLTCDLELSADIEAPDSTTIRASDRNKYVGSTFYEALLKFPVISRTIGEWLSGVLEFSKLQLKLSNVDGRFNKYLPQGASFDGWIGRSVVVKLGLRDVGSTYTPIFTGTVTPEAGFGRNVQTIDLTVRDGYDKINVKMPTVAFTIDVYPMITPSLLGKGVPLIYGDWTTALGDRPAVVPAYPVNGADPNVAGGTMNNVQLVVSVNANRTFDHTTVYLRRSSAYWKIDAADVTAVAGGNNAFEIVQNGTTVVDGGAFAYASGDDFFVQVKGKAVPGGFHDNFVEIARQVLIDFGGAVSGDFAANWDTYRDKASPAESAVSLMKCRVWVQESVSALELAISLLDQVRLEPFVGRDSKLAINALHFDEYVASPTFEVRNWDVVKDSWQPAIDLRNNFNRAKGFFSRMPDTGQNQFETPFFKNAAAVTQAGRLIEKGLVFPNHYVLEDVQNQTTEILKLASAYFEVIQAKLTWRSLLLDLGQFVKVNVKIGSAQYTDVPAMVREIGYDPEGLKIPVKLWSLQMVTFPGYAPGYAGIVGGSTATITQE